MARPVVDGHSRTAKRMKERAGGRRRRGRKAQNVSKHAFASRSKINAHSSRFETRARASHSRAQTLLYLCRLYIQCLRRHTPSSSASLSRQPFSDTYERDDEDDDERSRERVFAGRECERGSRMDSATRSWCNCMLIECASEYGIRMEAVRFDIPFCLRSSSLRPSSASSSSSGRLRRIRLAQSPVSFFPRRRERGCSSVDTA